MTVLENRNGEPMKLGMANGYPFVIKSMILNFSEIAGKLPTTVFSNLSN